MNQSMVQQKDPIGDSFNLLQVMRDNNDRLPCFDKSVQYNQSNVS